MLLLCHVCHCRLISMSMCCALSATNYFLPWISQQVGSPGEQRACIAFDKLCGGSKWKRKKPKRKTNICTWETFSGRRCGHHWCQQGKLNETISICNILSCKWMLCEKKAAWKISTDGTPSHSYTEVLKHSEVSDRMHTDLHKWKIFKLGIDLFWLIY